MCVHEKHLQVRAGTLITEQQKWGSSGLEQNSLKMQLMFYTHQHLQHFLSVWIDLDELLVQSRYLEEEINKQQISCLTCIFSVLELESGYKRCFIWLNQQHVSELKEWTDLWNIVVPPLSLLLLQLDGDSSDRTALDTFHQMCHIPETNRNIRYQQ